jgi:hypothetical protein
LLAWENALSATAEELDGATAWLAANPQAFGHSRAAYGGKMLLHLDVLQGRLREQRALVYAAPGGADDPRGTCTLCGGAGRVVVPSPAGVSGGEWLPTKTTRGGPTYYTCAVLCRCPVGAWLGGRMGDRDMLSLADYERANPRWRVQLAKRARQQAEAARLMPDGPRAEQLRAVTQRLREQFGLEGGKA